MTLQRLNIENFRCISQATLEFDARCNLITGANASGKTSLLEAFFFLGRGRSFRTTRRDGLVKQGTDTFTLQGEVITAGRSSPIGMRVSRERMEARYAGGRVSGLAELASVLPVQAIDPEVHRLVEDGPRERRRYLDWGVFHVEHRFVDRWRRYQKALKQRNAALRAGRPTPEIRAWETEFVEAGELVSESRQQYFELLQASVTEVAKRLLRADLELELRKGWASNRDLAIALRHSEDRDRLMGATQVGPHRADVSLRVSGGPARERVSRGQQKLLAASLLLGQLRCNAELGSDVAALLVDDPAAELDAANFELLLEEIVSLPSQLFVTALDEKNPALRRLNANAMFHVEHGAVAALV